MKRWLKWAILPLCLVFSIVAVQAYYWVKAIEAVDALIRPLKSIAHVEYQDISAFLFSPIAINNLLIKRTDSRVLLSIQKLTIKERDHDLLSMASFEQLYRGKLINRFILDVQGVVYLPSMVPAVPHPSVDVGCSLLDSASPEALLAYDFAVQPLEMTIAFEPSADKQQLLMNVDAKIQDMADIELQLWLGNTNGVSLLRKDLALSRVGYSRLRIRDTGLNTQRLNYCLARAALNDNAPHDLEAQIAEWEHLYGTAPSSPLKSLLIAAERPSSILEVLLEPVAPVSLEALLRTKVSDNTLITPADITLTLGSQKVTLNMNDWTLINKIFQGPIITTSPQPEDQQVTQEHDENESVTEPKPNDEEKPILDSHLKEILPGVVVLKEVDVKPEYRDTLLADLPQYIGRDVKVKTRFGKKITGRLTAADDARISVQYRMQQGDMNFPIYLKNISDIQVLR